MGDGGDEWQQMLLEKEGVGDEQLVQLRERLCEIGQNIREERKLTLFDGGRVVSTLDEEVGQGEVPAGGGDVLDLGQRLSGECDRCDCQRGSWARSYTLTRWRCWSRSVESPCPCRA